MEENPKNEKQTEDRLPDLAVNMDQAEEAKGGSISLNFTKIYVEDTPLGTEEHRKTPV